MVCKYQKGEIEFVRRYAPQDPRRFDRPDLTKVLGGDWFRWVRLRRDATLPSGWRVLATSEAYLDVDNDRVCCQAKIHAVRLRQGGSELVMPVGDDIGIDSLVHVDGSAPLEVVAVATNDADVVILNDAGGPHRLALVGAATFEGPLALGGPGLRHFTVESFTDSCTTDSTIRTTQHGFTILVAADPVTVGRGAPAIRPAP